MVLTKLSLIIIYFLVLLTRVEPRSLEKAPSFYINPQVYEYTHMGFQSLTGVSLWVQYLYRHSLVLPKDAQGFSWQFRLLDTITNLSPKFRAAYRSGGEVLSVVVNDIEGARRIFEKGIEHFPTHWPLLYSAAYHYMEEVKDLDRASELYLEAQKHGAPNWVIALAGKLYSEAGRRDIAIKTLESYLESFPEGSAREVVLERLKNLKSSP